MTYAVVASVKSILQIDVATYDTEIAACITSGDALVDSLLKAMTLTVPASAPQNIIDAANYFAAWAFRRKRDPAGAEAFWVEADKFLSAYIEAEKTPYVGSA